MAKNLLGIAVVALFVLVDKTLSITNCATESGSGSFATCTRCNAGYYPSSSRTACYACLSGCSTCTNAIDCSECKSGYRMNNTMGVKCDQCKVANCANCSKDINKCESCNLAYDLKTESNGSQTCNFNSKTALIIGLAVGIPLLVCCIVGCVICYCCCRKKPAPQTYQQNSYAPTSNPNPNQSSMNLMNNSYNGMPNYQQPQMGYAGPPMNYMPNQPYTPPPPYMGTQPMMMGTQPYQQPPAQSPMGGPVLPPGFAQQ